MQTVQERTWWKENVAQVETDGEWDHLIWTGDGISRYSAPKVTSKFGGQKNVRRVMWGEAFGELPPIGQEVVPNCEREDCISPRHAELMSQSVAASARAGVAAGPKPDPHAPWLYKGAKGAAWSDFTEPFGQAAAVTAHGLATRVLRGPINDGQIRCVIQKLPNMVRAELQRHWGSVTLETAIIHCLTSEWVEAKVGDMRLSMLQGYGVTRIELLDEDESDSWMIDVPLPTEQGRGVIEEPE